jgi:outer membrane protein OmpA-like peptidoglycan-associated protein
MPPFSTYAPRRGVSTILTTIWILFASSEAYAADVSFALQPAVAVPLSAPQSEIFGVGGGQSAKLFVGLVPWLDVGPTASFHLLPAEEEGRESGVVWAYGGGLRLKRPHDADTAGGVSPWADADLFVMQTSDLTRPGFDAGIGLAVPFGEERRFWVGPFARYLHIGQHQRVGFDNRDAKILTVGLSFEVGGGREREPTIVTVPAEVVPCPVCPDPVGCVDKDGDGVPDLVDRCINVVGSTDDYGCPPYKKIVVREDKLELREKLYFELDESTLHAASFPVLDEVAQALKDNENFSVQIQGHTDSSGTDAHNQQLSEERAEAVLNYLTEHGVDRSRLKSKGFASSVPLQTNTTPEGRELNRRVEFVVHFIILTNGSEE